MKELILNAIICGLVVFLILFMFSATWASKHTVNIITHEPVIEKTKIINETKYVVLNCDTVETPNGIEYVGCLEYET